jgi:L-seryl-tRNA(Ser) seleniumtransferase
MTLAGDPPIIVPDEKIERGEIELDACNLHPGEAELVAAAAGSSVT